MEQTLDELAKEARRSYYREWYAKNKDKVRAGNAEYWKRRAQKEQKNADETG